MKHLFTQLGTALIVLFALNINAQLVGLPELGVALSGTPDNPIVQNHSSQIVLGHVLRVFYANSAIPVNVNTFKARELWLNRGKGLEPNGTETPLTTFFSGGRARVNGVDLKTPTRVVLDSVIFASGQQVGPDAINNFAKLSVRVEAYKELASIAHNARNNTPLTSSLWMMLDQTINQRAPALPLALDLRAAHNSADADSPFDIADRVLSLPTLWRTK